MSASPDTPLDTPLDHRERAAIARLHALLELLPSALDRKLAPLGVTSFEYTLLDALDTAPELRLRLTALAGRTNATLPRLSRVVSALERRGLVERAACPEDGRATNAILTARGTEVVTECRGHYAEAARALILSGLRELPGDGVAQLTDVSTAILGALDPDRRLAARCGTGEPACPADPPTAAHPTAAHPTA